MAGRRAWNTRSGTRGDAVIGVTRSGHYLSLSFLRNEDAVRGWRCHGIHRQGQQEGHDRILAGYRLRVAGVMRDYGLLDRDQAPADSRVALI